jgi:Ca2+-binding EF-hand superfamily protein
MSFKIRTSVAVIAISALVVSLSACAQDGNRSQQMAEKAKDRFAAADINHDGFLSREEAQKGTPRLADHFDDIDTDHDGQLSTSEILAYLKQRRGSR